jgi:hypothetical protein
MYGARSLITPSCSASADHQHPLARLDEPRTIQVSGATLEMLAILERECVGVVLRSGHELV